MGAISSYDLEIFRKFSENVMQYCWFGVFAVYLDKIEQFDEFTKGTRRVVADER